MSTGHSRKCHVFAAVEPRHTESDVTCKCEETLLVSLGGKLLILIRWARVHRDRVNKNLEAGGFSCIEFLCFWLEMECSADKEIWNMKQVITCYEIVLEHTKWEHFNHCQGWKKSTAKHLINLHHDIDTRGKWDRAFFPRATWRDNLIFPSWKSEHSPFKCRHRSLQKALPPPDLSLRQPLTRPHPPPPDWECAFSK